MNEVNTNTRDQHLRRIINLEYKVRLPEMILARIDYPSMASSIEARSPFVDHNLIEYSCTLPFEIKMKDGRAKHIIKELSSDKLPDYILNSPKVGFGQLLTPFLNETLPEWFKGEIINDAKAPIKMYVTDRFLQYIYAQQVKNQRWGFKMWVLYALNKWLISNQ
jgi:asparagine synthase (glutamine-hydrolysing)